MSLPPPPLQLPIEKRFQGTYVLGKNGTGKSSLLAHLIAKDGHGVGVLDPHGDLIVDVLATLPAKRADDVVVLDLQDTTHPFALNLFDCSNPNDPLVVSRTAELVTAVFKRVWGDAIGPRSQDLLENMVYVMVGNPGATLDDAPRFLTHTPTRQRMVMRVPNEVVQSYWRDEFDLLSASSQQQITAPLLNKIRTFLRHPVLRAIVRQDAAPDFDAILRERKILLVRLDMNLPEATSLLGTLITLRLLHAALGRAREAVRGPFFLYADEFQRFATPDFGTLLQEARKFGIGTVLAHQLRSQLSRELKSYVLGAGTIVCFQLTAEDAREMAREFPQPHPRDPSFFSTQPNPLRWLLDNGHPTPTVAEFLEYIKQGAPRVKVYRPNDGRWSERQLWARAEHEFNEALVHGVWLKHGDGLHHDALDPFFEGMARLDLVADLCNGFSLSSGDMVGTSTALQHFEKCLRVLLRELIPLYLPWGGDPPIPPTTPLEQFPVLNARVRRSTKLGIIAETISVSHIVDLADRKGVHAVLQGEEPRTPLGQQTGRIMERNRKAVATPLQELTTPTLQPNGDEGVFAEEPPPKRQGPPKRKRIFE